MVRKTDIEIQAIKDKIKEIILNKTDGFTAYQITNDYFGGKSPTKNEWYRIHNHTGKTILVLKASGIITRGKEVESNAPRRKIVYSVRVSK